MTRIWDHPGRLSKSKTMEGPSAQSLMASPFGKGVEKEEEEQSMEVSTPSWDILGCPSHQTAQNHSRRFLEIQFPSAAGWNDLKCLFFPYFLLSIQVWLLQADIPTPRPLCPGKHQVLHPRGTRLFLHLPTPLRGG